MIEPIAGALIIAAAVYLVVRGAEVRLVLIGAGLLMAVVAADPLLIPDTFARAMVTGMVGPICAAMGFAAVLRTTGCDRHLVHLLLAPVRAARWLALPAGILAAYLCNTALSSQTSTAAALGPILVPLLVAAGFAPEVAAAALLLGASFGGDLLSPAAQDVQALGGLPGFDPAEISGRVVPATLAGILAATASFALLNRPSSDPSEPASEAAPAVDGSGSSPDGEPFRVHPLKALIPLVPVLLLLAAFAGWPPLRWLVELPAAASTASGADLHEWERLKGGLPVVRAMLIGTALAVAVEWRAIQEASRQLFEGMGRAYGDIISLTISAQCFAAGVAAVGISRALLGLAASAPWMLPLLSGGFPWALALLSGSGSGPVIAFGSAFLSPLAGQPGASSLAALACLGGAFGRTLSPVAAVVIYCSALVGVSPPVVLRRVLVPVLTGALAAFAVVLSTRG